MATKIDNLFAMLKDGNRRLIENRKKTIAGFERLIAAYKTQQAHIINQAGLGFIDEPDKD
jgi:hypothetical protein